MLLKSGQLFKLGDGPVNYDWNPRFFVLNYAQQELSYFGSETDVTPRGLISLKDALVSNITLIKEREHSFSVHCYPQPQGKLYFFSCNTLEESEEWQAALLQAAKYHKDQLTLDHPPQVDQDTPFEADGFDEFDERLLLEDDEDDSGFIQLEQIKAARMSIGGSGAIIQKNLGQFFNTRLSLPAGGGAPSRSGALSVSNFGSKQLKHPRGGAVNNFKQDKQLAIEKSMATRALSEVDHKEKAKDNNNLSAPHPEIQIDDLSVELNRDMGSQVDQETIDMVNKVQCTIRDDKEWKTVSIENGVTIQAMKPESSYFQFDNKAMKSFMKLLIIIYVVSQIVSRFIININPFMLGVLHALLVIIKIPKIISLHPRYGSIKGKVLVKGRASEIGKLIIDSYSHTSQTTDSSITNLDPFVLDRKIISKDQTSHKIKTEEILDLLVDQAIIKNFIQPRKLTSQIYWCSDRDAFYIIRRALPNQQQSKHLGHVNSDLMECFVCTQLTPNKCMLFMTSNMQYLQNEMLPFIETLCSDQILQFRLNLILNSVREQANLMVVNKNNIEKPVHDDDLQGVSDTEELNDTDESSFTNNQ